jgi:hypothetical protein
MASLIAGLFALRVWSWKHRGSKWGALNTLANPQQVKPLGIIP